MGSGAKGGSGEWGVEAGSTRGEKLQEDHADRVTRRRTEEEKGTPANGSPEGHTVPAAKRGKIARQVMLTLSVKQGEGLWLK